MSNNLMKDCKGVLCRSNGAAGAATLAPWFNEVLTYEMQ